MGTRVIIKVVDLLRSGCSLRMRIQHWPACDQGPAFDEELLIVCFPGNPREFVFDFVEFENQLTVECDYNSWGNTYKTLGVELNNHNVPHRTV